MKVKYFKAVKKTNRFNKNQRVWVRSEFANHMWIWFKWRGKGRYVAGTIDKFSLCIGEIKEIEVEDAFAKRIHNTLYM